jgi:hypothetical protein
LIYDKKTHQSFYFKGRSYPPIHFSQSSNFLFITTNDNNKIFLSLLEDENNFEDLEIEDRVIYKINQRFECSKIGELPVQIHEEVTENEIEEVQTKISNSFHTSRNLSEYSRNSETFCDLCGSEILDTIHQERQTVLCDDCWRFRLESGGED